MGPVTITAGELARAREDAADFLPSTAVITRGTMVDDQGGGGSVSWQNRATVACRVAPITAEEVALGGRLREDSDWIITLPALTEVGLDERLVIDGDTYRVQAVRDRDYEVTRRVEAKRST